MKSGVVIALYLRNIICCGKNIIKRKYKYNKDKI